ncbi:MAG TPA: hypothetical protein VJ749_09290 [Pyrinomonadaceae bacterium]|jgi:hypothetical protein|nr:hypothetical protein [Pyrinomonadaceae bacterium]
MSEQAQAISTGQTGPPYEFRPELDPASEIPGLGCGRYHARAAVNLKF